MGCCQKTISATDVMEPLNACAIGLSGRIKSGKTTLAQATAKSLGWPYVSFGDYVRRVARQRNLDPESRPVLQNLGESLIARGWPRFCRNVLATANWQAGEPIVVDGIRHVEAVDHLQAIVAPLRFLLIHVTIEAELQHDRIRREEETLQSLSHLERHSTEADVNSRLPQLAHLVVDGAKPIEEAVTEIHTYLLRAE